jgi:hypothetical protein
MSPTVTIYNRETGEARLVYRATLADFLATDGWTIEKPADSGPAQELKKALLPTAGREANRPASQEIKVELEIKAAEEQEKEETFESAPKRAPRRRISKEDGSPSSLEE